MRAYEFIKESKKSFSKLEDYDPNGPPPGPEFKPTMPKGTVRVDVSDVYDWYKLGQHISNLKGLGKHDFGKGPPSTILSFGDEDTEHEYIQDLEKTGLATTDIDPIDPNQPKSMKRQKTDPTFNVNEVIDPTLDDMKDVAEWMNTTPDKITLTHKQEPIDKFVDQILEMHETYDEYPSDKRRTYKIIKAIKEGGKPLPIYVDANDPHLFVMEGRHRMVAFWLLGMKIIPVAYVSTDINESSSGYIPSNAQKNDPRFKTALTKDVKPDSIQKNAKAFGFKTSRAGIPPLLRK